MTVAPEKRPTARDALSNPWVLGHVASDIHLKSAQDLIRQFNAKRKFKVSIGRYDTKFTLSIKLIELKLCIERVLFMLFAQSTL
jgi:hypothetical protein